MLSQYGCVCACFARKQWEGHFPNGFRLHQIELTMLDTSSKTDQVTFKLFAGDSQCESNLRVGHTDGFKL